MPVRALPKTVREAWGEEVAETFVSWIEDVLGESMIAVVAAQLEMDPRELARESLRTYLNQRLQRVRTDIDRLCGKYGVKSSDEMEALYKEDRLPEQETWEDFFTLDHLEARRDQLSELLETVR